eukprot:2950194-Pyramimonas_sp.AAC.1
MGDPGGPSAPRVQQGLAALESGGLTGSAGQSVTAHDLQFREGSAGVVKSGRPKDFGGGSARRSAPTSTTASESE